MSVRVRVYVSVANVSAYVCVRVCCVCQSV